MVDSFSARSQVLQELTETSSRSFDQLRLACNWHSGQRPLNHCHVQLLVGSKIDNQT